MHVKKISQRRIQCIADEGCVDLEVCSRPNGHLQRGRANFSDPFFTSSHRSFTTRFPFVQAWQRQRRGIVQHGQSPIFLLTNSTHPRRPPSHSPRPRRPQQCPGRIPTGRLLQRAMSHPYRPSLLIDGSAMVTCPHSSVKDGTRWTSWDTSILSKLRKSPCLPTAKLWLTR